jgi:gamma-glutamylcyclotransferase (GGCT)/AIG2-like uncharacterized protein YtfP
MSATTLPGDLHLFAYGTLMRGFENHARFCTGARSTTSAWVFGRLYAWTDRIPILEVPAETILYTGGLDIRSDLQHAAYGEVAARRPADAASWRHVRGELLVLPGAEARLRVLDALEGFHPRAPGHYARVLLPVHLATETVLAAWAYVAPERRAPLRGAPLDLERWDG